MAKARGPFPRPGRRSIRGVFYRSNWGDGNYRHSAWPRPYKQANTPSQVKAREQFAGVQRAARYRPDIEQRAAENYTKGTPYLPKDALISSAYGRWIAATVKGGAIVTGARIMADEIQSMLDTITNKVGSLLFRTQFGWRPLYPGKPNEVLTMPAAGDQPDWLPAQGGGGGGGSGLSFDATKYSGSYWSPNKATIATLATIDADTTITTLVFKYDHDTTGVYVFGAAPFDGTHLTEEPRTTTAVAPPAASGNVVAFGVFDPPLKAKAGEKWMLFHTLTNKGDTPNRPVDYDHDYIQFPTGYIPSHNSFYEAADAAPSTATSWYQDGNGTLSFGFLGSIAVA